jgi:magnesium transporter
MHVVAARLHNRYSQAVGADAAAMEDASPLTAAKMRVPWLMATILLELGAGVVISHFGGVLKRIILLASFMPVISAVSGNVGLQAAAITVRGLDTGEMSLKSRGKALLKEAATSLLMALACGTVLGIIGLIWSRHILFSVVIGGALVCSMLTAGLMGTIIPMLSKKLGFDPAATAGPFETSFQDIIGFGVFLSLATILLRSMH